MPHVLYRFPRACSPTERGQEARTMRKIYGFQFAWRIASAALLATFARWLLIDPVPALAAALLFTIALEVLLRTMRLPSAASVRLRFGYWFIGPGAVASLHFLPPRDLADARREMTPLGARRTLAAFLQELDALRIEALYVETNLPLPADLGFRRLLPASPLTWIFVGLQHHAATDKWNWRWPWVFVHRR